MTDRIQPNENLQEASHGTPKREFFSEERFSNAERILNETSDEEIFQDEIPDETELEAADPDDELLTAYIDGELNEEEKKQVEKRLAEDTDLAQRYQKLQFAGRVVESLASVAGDQQLTTSTMQLLSDVIQKEIERVEKRRFRRTLLILSTFFLFAFVAFAAGGWFAVRYVTTKRAELSVLRNHPKEFSNRQPSDNDPSYRRPRRPGDRGRSDSFVWEYRRGNPPPERNILLREKLPEELRQENLGALNRELFEFVRARGDQPSGDSSSVSKERLLFDFIQEKGVENLIGRLSEGGQIYIRTVDSGEQIRLLGLLIMSGLFERRNWDPDSAIGKPQEKELPVPDASDSSEKYPALPPPMSPPKDSPEKTPESFSREGMAKKAPSSRPGGGRGFFWKNETTGELTKTLKKLNPEQREELLNLPDEEMYAQLLIYHWGYDPKRTFPGMFPPGERGGGRDSRNFQRPSEQDSNRPKTNGGELFWKDWDEFVRKETATSAKTSENE